MRARVYSVRVRAIPALFPALAVSVVAVFQIMNPLTFFAHVALSKDARHPSSPEATANLLIEISDQALRSGNDDTHREFSAMSDSQKVDFAGEIGRTAALDFLDSEHEFSTLPVRRFVDFDLTEMPCYMSVREAPTRTLPNHSKVWRLAQCESDKLRTEPRTEPLSHSS
jgi:hypothetical protein